MFSRLSQWKKTIIIINNIIIFLFTYCFFQHNPINEWAVGGIVCVCVPCDQGVPQGVGALKIHAFISATLTEMSRRKMDGWKVFFHQVCQLWTWKPTWNTGILIYPLQRVPNVRMTTDNRAKMRSMLFDIMWSANMKIFSLPLCTTLLDSIHSVALHAAIFCEAGYS